MKMGITGVWRGQLTSLGLSQRNEVVDGKIKYKIANVELVLS